MSETAADNRHLIHDMPVDERPRERLRLRGPAALSNAELLAILLRTGSNGENVLALAQRLEVRFKRLTDLRRASVAELCKEKHIGQAKASQVLAALELGHRLVREGLRGDHVIRCAEDIYVLMGAEMALLEQEHLRVVLLNTRGQVMGVKEIYKGSVHTAVVRLAEVFRDAVREGCPAQIVVHNHPSGDPTPSAEDVALTKQLLEAGRLLNVELVDHVIIGRTKPASLKEMKLAFGP